MDYNIGDMIAKLADKNEEVYSIICKVSEVSGEVAELAPLNGDASLFDVKLIAGTSATPLLVTPVVGSTVIATFLSKDTAFVSLYSEIESVQLMGDQFGGLIKIEELVKKINGLENKLNDLISKFNTHIHITTATVLIGPPGVIAPPTTPETPIAPVTSKSDLENENIKHG
tara:strand:+ start:1338 stop:1850 length:513 start_codon:yes stop_codon:yes gene_type:complete